MASLAEVYTGQGRLAQTRDELRWALQTVLSWGLDQMTPLVVYQIALLYQADGAHAEAYRLFTWVDDHSTGLPEYK